MSSRELTVASGYGVAMVDVATRALRAEPLTPLGFAPFGQVLAREPDEAVLEVRDGEELHLNILSYERGPLRCDHLNAHHKATQALFPLRPTVLVVAPVGTRFDGADTDAALAELRAFVVDAGAGVNLALGTWHWGPYPIADRVDIVNLQGKGFAHDNEIVHLARDLHTVVEIVL
jgi:ureidoglycolate hydrolase